MFLPIFWFKNANYPLPIVSSPLREVPPKLGEPTLPDNPYRHILSLCIDLQREGTIFRKFG
jgi:hypothetical protein